MKTTFGKYSKFLSFSLVTISLNAFADLGTHDSGMPTSDPKAPSMSFTPSQKDVANEKPFDPFGKDGPFANVPLNPPKVPAMSLTDILSQKEEVRPAIPTSPSAVNLSSYSPFSEKTINGVPQVVDPNGNPIKIADNWQVNFKDGAMTFVNKEAGREFSISPKNEVSPVTDIPKAQAAVNTAAK